MTINHANCKCSVCKSIGFTERKVELTNDDGKVVSSFRRWVCNACGEDLFGPLQHVAEKMGGRPAMAAH